MASTSTKDDTTIKRFGEYADYATAAAAVDADTRLSDKQKEAAKDQLANEQYGPKADLSQFETLLEKLEGSKMRQQRQKSVEGRRDIYSQGLAQMMSNF
jgi:hypothetical protein